MVWLAKGTNGRPLTNLCAFYRHRVLMALPRMHAISILKHIFVVGEGFSKLPMLSHFPSLSFFDMLHVSSEGFGT
jgi:hypothetical protein